MSNCITSYSLDVIHRDLSSLNEIVFDRLNQSYIRIIHKPKKSDNQNISSCKISVLFEETESLFFTDIIKDLLSEDDFLEIGGSFVDPSGEGYVNSLGDKDYISIN
tara:strand:+ start:280 stop:597 length:318 start_codon:yes stop_codon:yes gene_type:complete